MSLMVHEHDSVFYTSYKLARIPKLPRLSPDPRLKGGQVFDLFCTKFTSYYGDVSLQGCKLIEEGRHA